MKPHERPSHSADPKSAPASPAPSTDAVARDVGRIFTGRGEIPAARAVEAKEREPGTGRRGPEGRPFPTELSALVSREEYASDGFRAGAERAGVDVGDYARCVFLERLFGSSFDPSHLKVTVHDGRLYLGSVWAPSDSLVTDAPGGFDCRRALFSRLENLRSVGDNVRYAEDAVFSECRQLSRLGSRTVVDGNLYIINCESLTTLPDDLVVRGNVYAQGCTHALRPHLRALKTRGQISGEVII